MIPWPLDCNAFLSFVSQLEVNKVSGNTFSDKKIPV